MATNVEKVFAFGDSIMVGAGTQDGCGWLQKLHHDFRTLNADSGDPRRFFYELPVPGDNAERLSDRAAGEIEARLRTKPGRRNSTITEKILSIVCIGVNDAWVHPKSGEPLTSRSDYAKHVGNIATTLASYGSILAIGLPACDEARYAEHFGKEQFSQLDSFLEYEEIASNILEGTGSAHYVPLTRATRESGLYYANLSEDGIHATAEGEQWLYAHIKPHFDAIAGV